LIDSPLKRTSPEVGGCSVAKIPDKVDLPAPSTPSKLNIWPSLILNETSFNLKKLQAYRKHNRLKLF